MSVVTLQEQSNGGIHVVLPPPGRGSPPSSPSNTPVSQRRRTKLKPRSSRKQSKPSLAPADLSTQESTTQGPGSSDSSDGGSSPDDGGTPLRTGDDILESCEEEGEESRSLTPNLKDPSTLTNQDAAGSLNGVLGLSKLHPSSNPEHTSDVHSSHTPTSILSPTAEGGGGKLGLNSDENPRLDSNETSDTDHQSLNPPSPSKDSRRWRRFESDLSTAPFSSETSDMDTSGNERVATTDSLVDVNGHGPATSPPLVKRAQVKGAAGKVGGADPTNSGSSGDEVLSRRKVMKRPIPASVPAKPLPPPVARKGAGVGPTEQQSQGSAGSTQAKKLPLQHTRSNPHPNRIVNPPSHANGGGKIRGAAATYLPTRSLSSKQNLSTRPKPPVGAKPPFKPPPPPKPQGKIGGAGMGVAAKPPAKPFANHQRALSGAGHSALMKSRTHSVDQTPSRTGQGGRNAVLTKTQSVMESSSSSHGGVKILPVRPPKVHLPSTTDDRKVGVAYAKPSLSRVPPPVASSKPTIPTKPRRMSHTEPPRVKTISKVTSSPAISDSSKNPSSSESQSPTNSPSPSPASQKKPLPPKPNKPSIMGTKKTSGFLLPSLAGKSVGKPGMVAARTPTQVAKEDAPIVIANLKEPQELSDTSSSLVKQGACPNQGESGSSSFVPASTSEISFSISIGSPSPPPIPPRTLYSEHSSPSIPQNDSSSATTPPLPLRGTDIATDSRPVKPKKLMPQTSSSSETTSHSPSPRLRSKLGPRRPPPSPPCVSPPPLIRSGVTSPSLNLPEDGGRERSNFSSQSLDSTLPLTSQRSSTPSGLSITSTITKPLSSSSELVGEEVQPKERYFEAHQNRESVADVSYAIVKRSSLRRKQGGDAKDEPTREEPAQDPVSAPTSGPWKLPEKEPESHVQPSRTRKATATRRPPPKSPSQVASTSNTYESIDEILSRRAERGGHKKLMQRSSFSPPPMVDDVDIPPPLPDRPAPKTHPLLKSNSSSSPNLLEPASYEGLVLVKDKDVHLAAPRTREPVYDEIPASLKKKAPRPRRNYEEIVLPEFEGDAPRLWVPPEKEREKQIESPGEVSPPPIPERSTHGAERKENALSISLVPSKGSVVSRLASNAPTATLSLEDLRENWALRNSKNTVPLDNPPSSPPHFRKRQAKSFSSKSRKSLMYKRNSSARCLRLKASTLDSPGSGMVRSSSLDRLDDRMERSIRNSIHHTASSSEDEDDPAIISPSALGLPKVPSGENLNLYKVPRTHRKPAGPFLCPPDVEPLYQYINTAEFLREPEERSTKPSDNEASGGGKKQNQLELARQLSGRKLWCELPEVIKSGVLDSLTSEERKLQEAIFEVISSENSYLRSLDVLIQHFMDDPGMNPYLPEGRRVIDKRQHHVIFSNVKEVREVSARFLEKLHGRQRESAVVRNIADIILDFAENYFDCYISYCTNQVYQIREMQDMIANPGCVMFREYLRRLESDKCCQNLNIQSFLLLPMQRITRLPLLILAILNRTPLDHPDHDLVENTLRSVQKLVMACNDGARQMDRTEQLHEIHKKLDFGKLKPFPLVSVSRQLERRGTLIRLQVEQKLLGKLKIKRKPLYLFVFTDYVIVTKRKKDPKGDYIYRVKDFASRAVVEVEGLDSHPGVSFPKFGEQNPIAKATYAVSTAGARHAFLLLLLDNASQKDGKYVFIAQNDTDKIRWLECLMRPDQKDGEKIYQHWDCPQVQAVYDYQAKQPDELGLERGDVVKVYRKMADGWYEGERLRDMQWGWFPSNFAVEIENAHTRARNLRQTHKLNVNKSNVTLAMLQQQPT